jgi:hypothetical protein
MRLVLALLVVVLALASGAWLVAGYEGESYQEDSPAGVGLAGEQTRKAEWQNPVAVLVGVTGAGIAIAILLGEHVPLRRGGSQPLE